MTFSKSLSADTIQEFRTQLEIIQQYHKVKIVNDSNAVNFTATEKVRAYSQPCRRDSCLRTENAMSYHQK